MYTLRNALQQTSQHLVSATPQDTQALHCTKLQHTATHCNTLQHTATHCNTLRDTLPLCCATPTRHASTTPDGDNTLQHTATHCKTLQNTLRHNPTLLRHPHETREHHTRWRYDKSPCSQKQANNGSVMTTHTHTHTHTHPNTHTHNFICVP